MKLPFTIIFISLTFYSCIIDTVYDCIINNNTDKKIQIKVLFDKHQLNSIYEGRKYFSFLKERIGHDSGVSMIKFDSINLTASYEILAKARFTLEHGMFGPDYTSYKKIIIFSKDTIVFDNKQEIENAFNDDNRNYIFTVE